MDAVDQVLARIPDPLDRYRALTEAERMAQALVERMARGRAELVAELHACGMSYADIGRLLCITRARAHQLAQKVPKPAL
jgi:hypothetical protein